MKRFLTAAVLSLSATIASAQENCYSIPKITEVLHDNFGEQPRVVATFETPGGVIIFVNPETDTWTLVTINANDIACIAGGGVGITEIPLGEQL